MIKLIESDSVYKSYSINYIGSDTNNKNLDTIQVIKPDGKELGKYVSDEDAVDAINDDIESIDTGLVMSSNANDESKIDYKTVYRLIASEVLKVYDRSHIGVGIYKTLVALGFPEGRVTTDNQKTALINAVTKNGKQADELSVREFIRKAVPK